MTDLSELIGDAVLAALGQHGLAVYRKKVVRNVRRRRSSPPMTDDVRRAILWDFRHTELNQSEIAERHGVNVGRVNEVVNGT